MRIHLIAIGTRMPSWVRQGFDEYARRLPKECRLELHELSSPERTRKAGGEAQRSAEAKLLLRRVPDRARVIALDEHGMQWTTAKLASRVEAWLGAGRDVALLVGGADGLDDSVKKAAECTWSLSPLTLPHMLVRVVVAEQLYRALSVLRGHPYHRQ